MAHRAGAQLLGLVSQTLSGAGAIPDRMIREIADSVPESATTCLLTAETDPARVAEHVKSTRTRAVQLVGRIAPGDVSRLRSAVAGLQAIKVIHVEGPQACDLAAAYFEGADALLLDTAVRGPNSDELGGTGQTHDWRISREIVRRSPIPVFLAGGLGPANVESAIRGVRPHGVDVCSGLRKDGDLDRGLLSEFVARAAAASA